MTTEKTPFGEVDRVSECVVFRNVCLEGLFGGHFETDVWLDPVLDTIEVKIDPGLAGTAISVFPALTSRIFEQFVGYSAGKVIVWVSDERDKLMWETWVDKAKKFDLFKRRSHRCPSLRHIIP